MSDGVQLKLAAERKQYSNENGLPLVYLNDLSLIYCWLITKFGTDYIYDNNNLNIMDLSLK